MREAMFYLASTAHVAHAHKMRGHRWATQESSWEDMAAKVTENMAECCDYIENNVLAGPYVLGEAFSLADAYLFVVCTWLKGDGVDIATYPKLQAFFDLMNDRPSVQRAREDGFLPRRKT